MALHLVFYGLRDDPFTPAPDPRFLHLTPVHQEALAQLRYGVQHRKGFMLLTGEVGTGKTTLLHTLVKRLDGTTATAFVTNSMLPFEGILEFVLEDLGIAKPGQSHAQRLFTLQNFLIERRQAGQNTLLLLDEAQNLTPETLEQIRLLSNFETPTEKVLQIVLSGQPELRSKLDLPGLRQLKQRVGVRCSIRPLTAEETRAYIQTRLRIAGAQVVGLFTPRAVKRIAEYTEGVPRLINTICDHSLMIGYADQQRRLDRPIVEEAISYIENDGGRRATRPNPLRLWRSALARWGLVTGTAATLVATATLAVHRSGLVRQGLETAWTWLGAFSRPFSNLLGL